MSNQIRPCLIDTHVHIYTQSLHLEQLRELQSKLTISVMVGFPPKQRTEKFYKMQKDKNKKDYISVPRGIGWKYIREYHLPYRELTRTNHPIQHLITMKFPLRDYQQEAFEASKTACELYGGCTISGHCNFGKTYVSQYLGYHLNGVMVLLVTTLRLAEQAKERIHQYMDGAYVLCRPSEQQLRMTKQLSPNIPGMKIATHIILTVQSLIRPKDQLCPILLDFLNNHCSIVIADEAHLIPAKKFRTCMGILGTLKYRIALTATPERKDKLHVWTSATFGDIVYRSDPKDFHNGGKYRTIHIPHTVQPLSDTEYERMNLQYGKVTTSAKEDEEVSNTVHVTITGEEDDDTKIPSSSSSDTLSIMIKPKPKSQLFGTEAYVTRVGKVILNPAWNDYILRTVSEEMTKSPTRCFIILTRYIAQAAYLHERFQHETSFPIYTLYGDKNRTAIGDQFVRPGTIVIATYSQGSTGLDFKHLNTIVFASPMRDVMQCIGRVLRRPDNMLIIDFVWLHNKTWRSQYLDRLPQYEFYGFFPEEEENAQAQAQASNKRKGDDSICVSLVKKKKVKRIILDS